VKVKVTVRLGVVAFAFVFAALGPASAIASTGGSTKTAAVPPAGISLRYPGRWVAFAATNGARRAQRRDLARTSTADAKRFALQAKIAYGTEKPVFYAANVRDRALAYVDVRVEDHGGFPSTLQAFLAGFHPEPGDIVSNSSAVRVGTRSGYRGDLHASNGIWIGSLALPQGRGAVLVNVLSSDDAAGATVVDGVLNSVSRA
jgi:hypothetical protein